MAVRIKCPYCDPEEMKLINPVGAPYSGLEVHVMSRVPQLRVRFGYEPSWIKYGRDSAQDVMDINFCPMCGRNLKMPNPQ